jgi:hypothetical protein
MCSGQALIRFARSTRGQLSASEGHLSAIGFAHPYGACLPFPSTSQTDRPAALEKSSAKLAKPPYLPVRRSSHPILPPL